MPPSLSSLLQRPGMASAPARSCTQCKMYHAWLGRHMCCLQRFHCMTTLSRAIVQDKQHRATTRRSCRCRGTQHALAAAGAAEGGRPQVAMEGDIVTIHYICRDEEGIVIDDSAASDEPVSFEVGAGEVMGNVLFQAFDEAIRGQALGSTTILEAKGGEWQRELFFEVPKDHEEITRLEGRYRNQGGLKEGMVVELANGASAIVVGVSENAVKIDANNMMAGKTRTFEVMLLDIEPAQR